MLLFLFGFEMLARGFFSVQIGKCTALYNPLLKLVQSHAYTCKNHARHATAKST